jgi:phage gp46-like protein
MPDIMLLPPTIGLLGDIAYTDRDIVIDGGLSTAVYISLFTDGYDSDSGEGGYWGDTVGGDPRGSLLWTVAREVISPTLPVRIKKICEDALQWLIDDGIASTVAVTVTVSGQFALTISIDIKQADASTLSLEYSYNWNAQNANGY